MIRMPGTISFSFGKPMRNMILATVLGLICASTVARGDDHAVKLAKARQAFQHDLVTLLALRADARPLLGAALLARAGRQVYGPLGFHHLIERAARAPDAGPQVNWVRLSDCDANADNCPNPDALKALEKQAPGNAAVWLLRMGVDAHHGDTRAAMDALRHASDADLYDDYAGRSLQALADSVTLLPPPAATLSGKGDQATRVAALQVMMVYGIGDAQPMPGFQLVAAQCMPDIAKDNPGRRALCLKLARVLVWGSSPLARSLGLHLQSTLSDDAAVRQQADTDMRDLTWQVRQFSLLQDRARNDIQVAHRLLMLARQGGNQMGLMQAALRAFSIPLQPPPSDRAPPDPPSAASSAANA